jgi:hypothetical protein
MLEQPRQVMESGLVQRLLLELELELVQRLLPELELGLGLELEQQQVPIRPH